MKRSISIPYLLHRVILENVPERETRAAISEGMRQLFDREVPPEEYERAD